MVGMVMFDLLIQRMEKSFHKRQVNLGRPSLFETIGKYTFVALIVVSLIQTIIYSLN